MFWMFLSSGFRQLQLHHPDRRLPECARGLGQCVGRHVSTGRWWRTPHCSAHERRFCVRPSAAILAACFALQRLNDVCSLRTSARRRPTASANMPAKKQREEVGGTTEPSSKVVSKRSADDDKLRGIGTPRCAALSPTSCYRVARSCPCKQFWFASIFLHRPVIVALSACSCMAFSFCQQRKPEPLATARRT